MTSLVPNDLNKRQRDFIVSSTESIGQSNDFAQKNIAQHKQARNDYVIILVTYSLLMPLKVTVSPILSVYILCINVGDILSDATIRLKSQPYSKNI